MIFLIIICSYLVSVLIGWIASFAFAPSIARRQINSKPQRKWEIKHSNDVYWEAPDYEPVRSNVIETNEVRGGGVLNELDFKKELNLLRWLFPVGLFRQLTQISDKALIEKNDPHLIAQREVEKEAQHEKAIIEINKRIDELHQELDM